MSPAKIEIRGAELAPFHGLDLDLPLGELICLHGPEGGGARELALGLLYGESRRRYAQVLSAFEREPLGELPSGFRGQISGLPPSLLLDGTVRQGPHVAAALQVETWLARLWQEQGESSCPSCGGLCRAFSAETAAALAIEAFGGASCLVLAPIHLGPGMAEELRRAGFLRVRLGGAVRRLDQEELPLGPAEVVLDRIPTAEAQRGRLVEAFRQARSLGRGRSLVADAAGGTQLWLNQQLSCQTCGRQYGDLPTPALVADPGSNPQPTLLGWRWPELAGRTLGQTLELVRGLGGWEGLQRPLAEAVALGLGDLPLGRPLSALSTGEHQALQLARCLGLGLTGILFVLENPGRGLDLAAQGRVATGLARLRGQGNTVLLVGATPTLAGGAGAVLHCAEGRVCRAQLVDPAPVRPQTAKASRWLRVDAGAGECRFPLGTLVALVGPTAAGKTQWLQGVVLPGLQARRGGAVAVEGRPAIRRALALGTAGRQPERMLLDQLGAFIPLAAQYAESSAARDQGFAREWFLLDRPGGRCPACEGRGALWWDLEFCDDLSLVCPVCEGRRYRPEALAVTWRGQNLAQVLDLTISAAAHHFRGLPAVGEALQAALGCGLGHRRLGETTTNLGRAEGLRLQLAGELRRAGPRDLLVLEHPEGVGDAADLRALVDILGELVERGVSVLVETHHPYLIAAARWRLEVQPGAPVRSGAADAA